ncbi:tetratricopeptide repeat-containing sensor histidine kinase [Aridibaculum aurantiacum]|uniref:tetratricopeptide repeat-containing sensor histidine kinase n=1 Tax=Aridibaculum aurantiacum TaxID=2810307 RepID=UPI001A960C81|nr:tetratricopeptide repeat protein [Aridibaculum aurantiacum]
MKNLAVAFAAMFMVCITYGQKTQIDSLGQLLTKTSTDTSKGRLLLQIASHWNRLDPDSAYAYTELAENLFSKAKYSRGLADVFTTQARIKVNINQIPTGLSLYNKALDLHKQNNNPSGIATVLNGIGVAFGVQENYSKALSNFLQALKIYEEEKDDAGMASSYLRIGTVYTRTNNLDEAMKFYNKALVLAEKNQDKRNISGLYNNIGSIYGQKNQLILSRQALLKSKQIAEQAGIWPVAAEAYLNLGNVYRELKKKDSAVAHFAIAEKHFIQFKNYEQLSRTYSGWAKLHMQYNEWNKATPLIHQSIAIAKQVNSPSLEAEAYEYLIQVAKEKNDYKESANLYQKLVALKDSIHASEKTETLERLRVEYQQEKDELLIKQLKSDNEEKTRQRNILLVLSAIGMLLLLSLVISFGLIYNKNIQLQRRKQELVELNNMKDKFLSVLSHDLRSPIGNILQLLQVVYPDESNGEHKVLFDRLKLTTGSVLETMDNMLAWGKNHFTQGTVEKQPVNMQEVITRVCRFLKQTADNKQISIKNNISSPVVVIADENQIEFVMRNLISNAVKFSHEFSAVEVYTTTSDNMVHIHVKDYGTGIHKVQQTKLFNLHARESTKGTAGETGSGLGLVLCSEFVELHKGSLNVISEKGEGTEFIVSLPNNA